MKPNDCKSIRREIDEIELGQELRSHVVQHLDGCRSCSEFYESRNKLRQIVSGLPAVEAPADFDFRLKARIAQTSPRRFRPLNFSFAFPSAVVAALALLVVGLFVLRSPSKPAANDTAGAVKSNDAAVVGDNRVDATAANKESESTKENLNGNKEKPSTPETNRSYPQRRDLAVHRGRIASQDSSSYGARIVKSEQPALSLQPQLVFPLQTITVSVDDDKGVSRTISFPTVSFGSQRVLAGNGSAFQTPTRTNW